MDGHIIKELEKKLNEVQSLQELDEVRRAYLGSKGSLKLLSKQLGNLPIEERKEQGKFLFSLHEQVESLLNQKEQDLQGIEEEKKLREDAESIGFTPVKVGHLHPITQVIRKMNGIFYQMGYSVMEGPELETDEYNFQRLNVPLNHSARDMQDTIYIEEPNYLLRTQTSSIESHILQNFVPPFKAVIPGRVYRNEKVNKSNHFIFHQYQGVVVMEQTSLKDLFGTFTYLFRALYGEDVKVRYRSKYYPEVEPGAGCDMECFNCNGKGCPVCKYVGWIEMGGSGMIHPSVLQAADLDTSKWMGFAFGLGLDRWVMSKYKITDIRSLLGGNLAYKYYEHENTI